MWNSHQKDQVEKEESDTGTLKKITFWFLFEVIPVKIIIMIRLIVSTKIICRGHLCVLALDPAEDDDLICSEMAPFERKSSDPKNVIYSGFLRTWILQKDSRLKILSLLSNLMGKTTEAGYEQTATQAIFALADRFRKHPHPLQALISPENLD